MMRLNKQQILRGYIIFSAVEAEGSAVLEPLKAELANCSC